LMSCSKSLTACYFGVLVGRGLIDPQRMVVQYLPQLQGTAWDGCSVRDVLDMRAGTHFDESNYDDPLSDGRLIEEVSGYRPCSHVGLPKDTFEWINQVQNIREHGGMFEYRSLLTDVLAWIIEAVTGKPFAEGFAHAVWAKMGAEQDAEIIVDEAGFPVVEGGISTTARDFARFGLMCLQNGKIGGQNGSQQVLPAEWLARLRKPDADLIAAYTASQGLDAAMPDACYCDQWWVLDPTAGIYCAYGIHGQQLFIHHPSQTVIAKFSTWPSALSGLELQDAGMFAMCDWLRARG
ncbi:MAG: serine hydrolase, partial [Rhodoferax sp.]|nr:serine hydrolase [Rhodoferax sp.]